MRLNIRNPRARELAAQLAELTGESLTTAVIRALEEGLERRRRGQNTTVEKILTFANRFALGMPRDCHSIDHASFLYGEDGLPR